MPEQPLFKPKSTESLEQHEKLSNISFVKEEITKGKNKGTVIYKSSSPDRKMAVLEDNSTVIPEPNLTYDAEIITDTDTSNPAQGKYIVRISRAYEDGVPLDIKIEPSEIPEILTPIGIDRKAGKAYVLDIEIPYTGKESTLVPDSRDFKHFCLDQRTLLTLRKLAEAVKFKIPCLLEGITSTSKTSSCEFLAMVTGNEVERMNFNGQTDTSELIGKFVPNDGQLQIQYEDAIKNWEQMPQEAQNLFLQANKEGRTLTKTESAMAAKFLGLKIPEWRWEDGIVPRAMKEGRWIILDELNLAEPAIIARLNSVTEKNPSIVLTENGGQKIGPKGDHKVAENFRIFATQNPAEYEGRRPLSPAERDRFRAQIIVPAPTAKDYEAMLNLMVFGLQPDITHDDIEYKGGEYEPVFPGLAKIPGMAGFLSKLSQFQEKVENLSRNREIGRAKKEPYIFTRRGLLDFLEYASGTEIINRKTRQKIDIKKDPKKILIRAIQFFYLDKIYQDSTEDLEDLTKVDDALSAVGLGTGKDAMGNDKWTHKFQ